MGTPATDPAALAAQATNIEATQQAQAQTLLESVIEDHEARARERFEQRKEEFEFNQRLARTFAASGCFADIKGCTENEAIAKALVKIELGAAMGFSPAESMTGIDIIQGRVAVGANLRAARMQRAGFSWRFAQMDSRGCAVRLYFRGQPLMDEAGGPAVVSYTEDDAKLAKLVGKDNYVKNPSDMYFARCITRAQRRYAPGVLGLDILSTEEAIDLPAAAPDGSVRGPVQMPQRKSEQATAGDGAPQDFDLKN